MEEIKNVLAYWEEHEVEFNAKLLAREETGCCDSVITETDDAPCKS